MCCDDCGSTIEPGTHWGLLSHPLCECCAQTHERNEKDARIAAAMRQGQRLGRSMLFVIDPRE